jgi:hypothetical protein
MFAVVAAGLTQSRAAVTLAGATLREDEARTEKMPSPDWIPVIQNFVPRGTKYCQRIGRRLKNSHARILPPSRQLKVPPCKVTAKIAPGKTTTEKERTK